MKVVLKNLWLIVTIMLYSGFSVQAQHSFRSVDSLISYACRQSSVLKSDGLKMDQAKKAKLAALLAISDISANVSLNVTDNTKLPVSLFPAEAFGGAPGTYTEVRTGIQYTNDFSQNAEIKLLNVSGWQNYKLAKINVASVGTDNKISRKTLYENIATCYYNIVTLQEQLLSVRRNLAATDTILMIAENKYDVGIARQQDVNDAKANNINTAESLRQIELSIEAQYLALKVLCDIPEHEKILIEETVEVSGMPSVYFSLNELNTLSSHHKQRYALYTYKQAKGALLPSLNGFVSNSNQQFSQDFSLFDRNVNWINSNYIGLRLTWQLPTAATIAQINKARYDYLSSVESAKHQKLKSILDFEQLKVDLDKSRSQMQSSLQISGLGADTYRRNLDNYKEGVISLDKLLQSFRDMVNSDYNAISSIAALMLTEFKIKIYNEIR